jgi:UDP-2,3-diacylglucosamine pyrophosphatase LpxH
MSSTGLSKVVVTSDQHIGYQNSNVADFGNFLDGLLKRDDVKSFVILGDFVDMWRRDVSGLFLENSGILDKVLALRKSQIEVYVVAGNHDYHVLKLTDHGYPFEFRREPSFLLSGITSTFVVDP